MKNTIKEVKNFTITTNKKALHKTKVYELKDLLDELSKINIIFISDYYYTYKNYKNAIELDYNKTTKNKLDNMLSRVKKNILRDLVAINNQIA